MSDLRIAVLGVGMMGADHVARIGSRSPVPGSPSSTTTWTEKAEQLAATIPGCRADRRSPRRDRRRDVDAVVLATPGTTHEKQLLACLEHGKPVMCEKPLTTDVATSLGGGQARGRARKAVDPGRFHAPLRRRIRGAEGTADDGELGTPLVMHCVHRNAEVPPNFDSSMIVKDSLVHEVDVTRFLFDEEITSIQVIKPAANPNAPQGLQDPQIAIFQTASGKHVDVEVFVTTGVAYEVRTEVVGERGSAMIGLDVGLVRKSAPGHWGGQITPSFKERFGLAYDVEIQRWVDAVRSRGERRRPGRLGRVRRGGGVRGRRRLARVGPARRRGDGVAGLDHGRLTRGIPASRGAGRRLAVITAGRRTRMMREWQEIAPNPC